MDYKLKIADNILNMIIGIIKNHVQNREILAYGSRVYGVCHDGSDLDLVIRDKENPEKPYAEFARLRSLFQESDIPILVDIQDWALLPDDFRKEIDKRYIKIV